METPSFANTMGLSDDALLRRVAALASEERSATVNLSTLRLLAPHLTAENHERLLTSAKGRTKREVEKLVASEFPCPDAMPSVRKLPGRLVRRTQPGAGGQTTATQTMLNGDVDTAGGTLGAGGGVRSTASNGAASFRSCQPVVAPSSAERYRVQFTVRRDTHEKLRRVQDLMRREIPDGDPGVIFDRALTLLLEDVVRRKAAMASRPRPARKGAPHRRDRATFLRT
jgi:hypothetical protein